MRRSIRIPAFRLAAFLIFALYWPVLRAQTGCEGLRLTPQWSAGQPAEIKERVPFALRILVRTGTGRILQPSEWPAGLQLAAEPPVGISQFNDSTGILTWTPHRGERLEFPGGRTTLHFKLRCRGEVVDELSFDVLLLPGPESRPFFRPPLISSAQRGKPYQLTVEAYDAEADPYRIELGVADSALRYDNASHRLFWNVPIDYPGTDRRVTLYLYEGDAPVPVDRLDVSIPVEAARNASVSIRPETEVRRTLGEGDPVSIKFTTESLVLTPDKLEIVLYTYQPANLRPIPTITPEGLFSWTPGYDVVDGSQRSSQEVTFMLNALRRDNRQVVAHYYLTLTVQDVLSETERRGFEGRYTSLVNELNQRVRNLNAKIDSMQTRRARREVWESAATTGTALGVGASSFAGLVTPPDTKLVLAVSGIAVSLVSGVVRIVLGTGSARLQRGISQTQQQRDALAAFRDRVQANWNQFRRRPSREFEYDLEDFERIYQRGVF